MYANLLVYRNSRYFWFALGLLATCVVLFGLHSGSSPRGGDTWEGYTLGSIGAALVLWLSLLGIRKRSYASALGTISGWTSAHVYLGLALLVVATLHCAGHFGLNVHTLAYALMVAVIVSGIVGVSLYLSAPPHLIGARQGRSKAALFAELQELNASLSSLAGRCRPEVSLATQSAVERTAFGGGVFAQLLGADRSMMVRTETRLAGCTIVTANLDQQPLMEFVSAFLPRTQKRSEVKALQELIALLGQRQVLLRQLRRDMRLSSWLTLWLYVHVPLTVGLIASLSVHILVTFLYW
jgi:hypothetical protein